MTMGNWNNIDKRQPVSAESTEALINAFISYLKSFGCLPKSITKYENSSRYFLSWLNEVGILLSDVDEHVLSQFSAHRRTILCFPSPMKPSHTYVNRVRRFIKFYSNGCASRPAVADIAASLTVRISEYINHLKIHRGLRDLTIKSHCYALLNMKPIIENEPKDYDATIIRNMIINLSSCSSRSHMKNIISTLRSYLRFLIARGECQPCIDQAVPTIAYWHLSTLPRYLLPDKVDMLIASCNLSKPAGIRDRAILLLLARLGLRAGDVSNMRLGDIEWEDGTLRVIGKGRREVRLPLPQEVGDAILDYLNKSRPNIVCDRLFLRSRAPYRPFVRSSAVSVTVRRALERSGITDAPSQGAHLLRHSAATTMLRAGATLDTVGAVLRHRSSDTTAHYAKVDVVALRQIAQPWPGGVSC